MKLVINISEEFYDGLFDESYDSIQNIPLEHMVLVQKIKNGKPLDTVLDEIKAEIPKLTCGDNEYRQALVKVADVIKCIDKYRKGESE